MTYSVTVDGVTGDMPVTLDEAKAQCRVEHGADDELITRLIATAAEYVEAYTGQVLRASDLTITFDRFTPGLALPRAPVRAVTGLSYGDTTIEDYRFQSLLGVPTLRPLIGATWPVTREMVTVTVEAGYEAGSVPMRLRQAMLMLVADWYRDRENTDTVARFSVPASTDRLLVDFRLSWL